MSSPRQIHSAQRNEVTGQLLALWERMVDAPVQIDRDRWHIADKYADVLGHEHLAWFLNGIGAKSAGTFRAVDALAALGIGSDALVAQRTLIETYCTLAWVVERDWSERLVEHMVYAGRQWEKVWSKLSENGAVRDSLPNIEGDTLSQFMAMARQRLDKDTMERLGKQPPFNSVEGMLQSRGLASLADGPYRLGARSAHATDIGDHATLHPDGTVEIRADPRWVDGAWFVSAHVFADILSIVDQVGSYGLAEQLTLVRVGVEAAPVGRCKWVNS